ncbi:MAG: hypothetical protein LBG89_01590 [Rickettsiales bacterium]|jgi:hypothetical protein|nr:hypothetical protein [Rickettsiales bacterium]
MEDKRTLSIVQEILDIMHNKETGIVDKNLDVEKFAESRNERPIDTKFSLGAAEILKKRAANAVGCTGWAKTFLYLAKEKGIDAVGIITISMKTYSDYYDSVNKPRKRVDVVAGHVIAGIKLSDGKYHMIDPGAPQAQFFGDEPKIGNIIYHALLYSIKDKPYLITGIDKDLEKIKSYSDIQNASVSGDVNNNNCIFVIEALNNKLAKKDI